MARNDNPQASALILRIGLLLATWAAPILAEEETGETVRLDGRGSVYNITDWQKISGSLLEVRNGAVLTSGSIGLGGTSTSVTAIEVGDPTSEWRIGGSLDVGKALDARLTILRGGLVKCESASLADGEKAHAAVKASGPGSQWILGDHLTIGNAGEAALELAEDARVTVSNWLTLGNRGQGQLQIVGGASLRSNNWAQLGYDKRSFGDATLKGKGSQWLVGAALTVGEYGRGRLMVSDGATLSSGNWASIGSYENSEGTVIVTGTRSSWTSDFTVSIGYAGKGTLEVTDGGAVSSKGMVSVGEQPTGVGAVLVSGKGSSWSLDGRAEIGAAGRGSLRIAAGASVDSKDHLYLGGEPGSGRLQLSGYGSLTTGGLSNDGGIELDAPGSVIKVQHDFNQGAEGATTLWLGAGGSPVLIEVAGAASLAGTLEIKKQPGAELSKGDAYIVLSAKNVQQWFDRVVVAPELKNFDVQVKYARQQVSIELGAGQVIK